MPVPELILHYMENDDNTALRELSFYSDGTMKAIRADENECRARRRVKQIPMTDLNELAERAMAAIGKTLSSSDESGIKDYETVITVNHGGQRKVIRYHSDNAPTEEVAALGSKLSAMWKNALRHAKQAY
jgi:broad specificity phosphatase PhoE